LVSAHSAAPWPSGLNDIWKWIDKDLTLVTIPKAGHIVHGDASELVTRKMLWEVLAVPYIEELDYCKAITAAPPIRICISD
jgi:hypothetical protein